MKNRSDNERIARWLGYQQTVGLTIRHWVSPRTGTVASIEFDSYVDLWHGPNGLLSEIEKRNEQNKFIHYLSFEVGLDLTITAAEAGWAICRADSAQLAAALVKMIEAKGEE